MVWLHLRDAGGRDAATGIARRIAERRGVQPTVIVTFSGADPGAETPFLRPPPPETRAACTAFLDHWRPDVVLWIDTPLRPALMSETARRGIPMHLVDARGDSLQIAGASLIPGLLRYAISLFDQILAVDDATGERIRRLGASCTVTGRTDIAPRVPGCDERDRADLVQSLGARPIWLAADVAKNELDAVCAAHRHASRRAHRLLMIAAVEDADAARDALGRSGFACAERNAGLEPVPATQVYLTDTSEMGLWYRLAPVCFLGGSLVGPCRCDPTAPAALGSAILAGPETAPFGDRFSVLEQSDAATRITDGDTLGQAVEALLSPDRAARMAHAAWDVISRGAGAETAMLDLVDAALDRAGA